MTIDSLELFLNWLTQHAVWVNIFIFLVAMSESLLVIGLIVPGFLLMVGFGALIATGYLDFWPTTLIATAGAIAGDGLSYWLGYHYRDRLLRFWPLSKYPSLIKQGQRFFSRHGKKSVVLGRFFGPLRAIVPTIAGMSLMPASQFYISNILSAIAWAPLYLLPGILFGMSLQLAKEFAGQLVFIIIVIIVISLLAFHLVRLVYSWLAPQADVLVYRLLIWSRKHPVLGAAPNSLVNPDRSEIRAISSFAIILTLTALTLIFLNHYLFNTLFVNNINTFISTQMYLLQHPEINTFANSVITLNHNYFIAGVVTLFSASHIYTRNYKPVIYLLLAVVLPWLFLLSLKSIGPSVNALLQHSYNSSYLLILAVTVYGFITTYLAKQFSGKISQLLYILFLIAISVLILIQLYTGYMTLSVIIGHTLYGILWVTILSIAYRRHSVSLLEKKPEYSVIISISLAFLAVLYFFIHSIDKEFEFKTNKQTEFVMSHTGWLETGWHLLPVFRNDIRGYQQQPVNIQWAETKQAIIETLTENNWLQANNSLEKYFNWFKHIDDPLKLPVVRHLDDGKYNTLTFIKLLTAGRFISLRLWPSAYYTQSSQNRKKLWYGEISYTIITRAPFVNYLTTENQFSNIIPVFIENINTTHIIQTRQANERGSANWDGKVILLN